MAELSSPEELEASESFSLALSPENSLESVGEIDSSMDFNSAMAGGGNSNKTQAGPINPLLTEGIFPYQANPVSAIISAGLTLAFMSWKETGQVDVKGLLFLLNSTDLYAGLAGSMMGSTGQKAGQNIVSWIGRGARKLAPEMLEPLAQKEAVQMVGNIVNGFTYTFSVSAGYETFSQFWKIATKNIPEARTVTGFMGAPSWIQRRVLLNLMYYTMIDKNLQKRVFDSIYYHRVMTFEFIAMNIGLYVGAQLGNFVAKKYMPGNVWAQRLAPTIGSVTGGVLMQMIPDSWKFHFNQSLLNWKISSNETRLQGLMAKVQDGISQKFYPARSNKGIASYWMSGFDLEDDIERIFATRDLLMSFYMQRALSNNQVSQVWTDISDSYSGVRETFESQLAELSRPEPSLANQIEEWIKANKTPEEIQQLSTEKFRSDPKKSYYQDLLNDAVQRSKDALDEINGLQAAVRSDD